MASEPGYAELAAASNFSFLRGASHPEELVVTARRLGLAGLGLADRNTVSGTVRAHMAAKEAGLEYRPGARLVFSDGTPDVLAYPRDRRGWGRLCRLLTAGNLRGEKGAPVLLRADLSEWGEGLSLAVLPKPDRLDETCLSVLQDLKGAFGRSVRLALTPAYDGRDRMTLEASRALAQASGVKLMAVGDVTCHDAARRSLGDVLAAIREHVPLTEAGYLLSANGERHLKPATEMARLFRAEPAAVAESLAFFGELGFSLDALRYQYPDEPCGDSASPQEALERLAWEGARTRYGENIPDRIAGQIRHELALIAELDYAPYFLTVHDIVRFARSQNILCQGRGSAANSTVCFCIGITEVDPVLTDLLFERFISPERREPPDIDVDFEHEKREIVIQYIYEKYGRDRAGLAATVITYRARSAAREVAKAFGLSEDVSAAISGSVWGWSNVDLGEREAKAAGLDMSDRTTQNVLKLSSEIMGFPRHLSQHVGGFVITRDRLDEVVPITKSAMDGRTMVEWDKDDLDSLGILKIDILALGMLTCIRRAFDLLEDHYDRPLTLASIPKEEAEVYDMVCRADTLGVFQIESRAQMTMLPRLRPRNFYDLVIEVAIVRPGPIQGDMVHPYLRRRQGKEPVSYPSRELEAVLGKTLGVPLFQEQAMKIAIVAAGFTPGEADRLRRAMATFRRVGTIHTFQTKMIEGMVANGYEADFAERCFRQIEGFGEYGFPESHAASFALLVYASCWLKAHYPDVFCAAILNAQPMGFYAPAQLVRDAREHGVEMRPVDINASGWDNALEDRDADEPDAPARISPRHREMRDVIQTQKAVRLGFRQVKGLREDEIAHLIDRRGGGYDSVRDLWLRSGLARAQIERLADADAFRSIGLDRRGALWAVRALDEKSAEEHLPLFERPALVRDPDEAGIEIAGEAEVALPPMPPGEQVVHDYRYLSLSLKAHPVSFLRRHLDAMGVLRHEKLDDISTGRRADVAGLVLVRQRPGSAKGVIFMTLEDETGVANVIVWPKVFERYRALVLGSRLVRVTGKLQNEMGVIHIVADRVEDLTPLLADIETEGIGDGGLANADEVRRPVIEIREKLKPRSRLAQLLKEAPQLRTDYETLKRSEASARVLPKGRNFH
ncbi:error-prone DNA polymerase [Oricola nitratireducens]|uniref:error-prone DNA polymerase n=1 Tax=Oricola nitratireducens TaxID=2775868 RepID=UPI001865C461|nr:error-prone DNA polymerase [Oricola nitratireducens]